MMIDKIAAVLILTSLEFTYASNGNGLPNHPDGRGGFDKKPIPFLPVSKEVTKKTEFSKGKIQQIRQTRQNSRKESLEAFENISKRKRFLKKKVRISKKNKNIETLDRRVLVTNRNKEGKTTKNILMGESWLKESIGRASIEHSNSKNLLSIYKNLYSFLPVKKQKKFDLPDVLAGESDKIIEKKTDSIIKYIETTPFQSATRDFVLSHSSQDEIENDCSDEYGYDMGTDLSISSTAFSSVGLMKNGSFPLRTEMTCVKDQGLRGTCYAFAAIAMLETNLKVEYNFDPNLSEQHLNYYNEVFLDSDNEEGANTWQVIRNMRDLNYQPSMEHTWNYNQSNQRLHPYQPEDYRGVCKGYHGEQCSGTVHQGEETEYSYDGRSFRGYSAPEAPITYSITDAAELWDYLAVRNTLSVAKTYLQYGYALLLGMNVDEDFQSPTNGYISISSSADNLGGHEVLLIGWVSNSDLPSGAPSGDGGGYFVAKNSWGESAGDQGYFYIPYDYVKDHGNSLITVASSF